MSIKTNKNKSPRYRSIKAIEDKYGLMAFRCGLSNLVSCGAQALADTEEVIKAKAEIQINTPVNSIMTADFQCDIIDCSVDLSGIDVWDLFRYIQTDVVIDGWGGCEE